MALNEAQVALGVGGNVGEIGVHHGKLFLLLCLMRRGGETAVAVDVFEDQQANIDNSGCGSRQALLQNLDTHAGGREGVVLLQSSSTELAHDDIRNAAGGPLRLFSIDGGHTAEITANDFALAAASLAPGGIVILDDYFQPAWPGVSEGTNRFFSSHPESLIPFAISANKLLITNSAERAHYYREALVEAALSAQQKETLLFGAPVVCLEWPQRSLRDRLAGTSAWKAVRENPAGKLIRRLIPQDR